jgi:AAA+ ATPase superfamily predicted ATPase
MRLPFLDRDEELARLRRTLDRRTSALVVLYGRRRCGKSRLLLEALRNRAAVYYVGDDREAALQRGALASEVGRLLPGFERVTYPDWEALLERFWREAPSGAVLALDELPSLVWAAKEIPSLLQKQVDRGGRRVHLALAGSSQRMMHGLVLDRAAPLYGRATEILPIGPLRAGWITRALSLSDAVRAVEAYAVWGGVPRYWELAARHGDLLHTVRDLVLSPLGVLHDEPAGLLLDDLRDTVQAASILSLIGAGARRLSEIAGRLQKPATSLSRPLQRLVELGLVRREMPYGASVRDTKRTFYEIEDPFLRFWFRFVEPNRSLLEARRLEEVVRIVKAGLDSHVAGVWEDLARASVGAIDVGGRSWKPPARWWGAGLDRQPLEIDVVAESLDGEAVLVGEAKWTARADARSLVAELRRKAANLPLVRSRPLQFALWLKANVTASDVAVIVPSQVLTSLR